ncbi:MAG TPA: hypothetical protein VKA67_05960 [Verrucomicrobiae bacterium]|nr:hypothetical protein [Verrucomicrobiae bacterium]
MKTQKPKLVAASLALALLSAAVPVQAGYVDVTDFAKTANDQTNLQLTFPVGFYTATNSFATPFDITSNTNGKNYCEISGGGSTLIVSNLDLPNVTAVFTLMNAYNPVAGPLASVEFIGSAGADQTLTLVGGVDIRDFYQGSWQNAINGTTTQTAYQINNVQGGAGTGNSQTGLFGTYRLDEQAFVLPNAFLGQNLRTIKITNLNGSSTPFVVAITAQVAAPTLNISHSGKTVTVYWQDVSGWTNLEQNSSLTASAGWTTNTDWTSANGTNSLSLAAPTGNLFFRLKQ